MTADQPTFGIPDPGGPSGTFAVLERTANPFDAGRIPCPQGGEDRWSARWLMDQMGYPTWQHFEPVVERAKTTAHNEGFNVKTLFTVDRKNTGGRPQTDYLVTRYAAYLIAMNGDPRKREVSAAQHYFAVKTRQAEVAAPRELTDDEKIHEALQISARRVEALKARVAELEPPAAAWTELAEAAGDYSVADAAKVLSRDPAIATGERRLFQSMSRWGWIYREGGRWRAYQRRVEDGRLVEKIGRPYLRNGVKCLGDPTVRITPKGIETLQKLLGGGSGQLALAVAE